MADESPITLTGSRSQQQRTDTSTNSPLLSPRSTRSRPRSTSSQLSGISELPRSASSHFRVSNANRLNSRRQTSNDQPEERMFSPASTGVLENQDITLGSFSSPLSYSSLAPSQRSSRVANRSGPPTGNSRPDFSVNTRHHNLIALNAGDEDQRIKMVIWGTRIVVSDVQHKFKQFLSAFRVATAEEDELAVFVGGGGEVSIDTNLPYYVQRLEEIALTESPSLNLNLQHLKTYDEHLYAQIITYPTEVIPYLDMTAQELLLDLNPGCKMADSVQIRPFNAKKTRNMRGLNPEDIDTLITVSGMITRTSVLIPEMRVGYFECNMCKFSLQVEVDRGRIEEPVVCENCNTNHCFSLIHNRSLFLDKQMLKLQESPDDMPAGQTPHTVTLFTYGDLVDSVNAGDRITVTGIYRAMPLRLNPRMTTVKAVYKTYIDVLHFRKSDTHKLHADENGGFFSAERLNQIMELSRKPDVYERLAHGLAPSIFEHEDIKKGLLCLLFGGTRKELSDVGRTKFRSDINMLLCGDPGTSKSQLLQYVHGLVPRSQYTSGKGSSAVGLTAYVTKDPETHQLVLQTGALVLSDNGVCCIDEFDKMSESTRSVLHEVMEQQTLSIAKAGIICQLNARASILAAANPVDSQWNRDKTIIENVQLPHTLLSRFDLIFLMVDPQDEFYDRRLATHLVSLYYRSAQEEAEEYLDMSLIRDYIAYSKAKVHPKLTEEAGQLLIKKYVDMRRIGSGHGQVSAFPRQLESLIRLSEAHAKIRLSPLVEVDDVEEADRLHREALKQSAIDPQTGKVDINILALGHSSMSLKQAEELGKVIKQKLAEKQSAVHVKVLLAELRESSNKMITREIFDEALNELKRRDVIDRDNNNRIKLLPRAQMSDD